MTPRRPLFPVCLALASLASALGLATAQEAPPVEDIVTAPGLEERKYIGPLADAYNRIDPTKDGWATEAVSAEASAQLGELAHLLEDVSKLETLDEIAAKDFQIWGLRPPVKEVFNDGRIAVQRSEGGIVGGAGSPLQGPSGLAEAIRAWFEAAGLGANSGLHPHGKAKLFRIDPLQGGGAISKVLFTVKAHGESGHKQINATWNCRWATPEDGLPLLQGIEVEAYEEVQVAKAEALLADATEALMGKLPAYREQFLHSTDHWRLRIPRDFGLDVVANHGFAIGDINGDGLEDLYICQQGGLPNRLLLQNADGTLRDFTEESQTGWLDYCSSALLVDLDNDGDKDLVVAQDFKIIFMDNLDGKGHFELAFGSSTKAQSFSLAAADVDEDGLLDVYVCGYNPSAAGQRSGAMGEPIPFHDANNGGPNILWRNVGNWEFADITALVGLDANNRRFSFAASWEDFDNDGDLDLYVANDYGRNCLYRNDGKGRRFTEIAGQIKLEDTSAGMSSNWADFNRDGWMDLYVSNMFSSAGNRITYQKQFQSGLAEEVRQQFQRMARGNTLFQSDGKGGFTDVSVEAGVTMGRWSWGSSFVDLNNDGWEDILVANGFITTEDTGDL